MSRTVPRCFALALLLAPLPAAAQQVRGPLLGNAGQEIGAVTAIAAPGGVLLHVKVLAGGLTPGPHGMHLHAVADCSDHDRFQHSAAHINPDRREHGLLNPNGPDRGDLPNLYAFADGSAEAEVFTALVRLRDGEAPLIDSDGSALLIHASPDDHQTQPIGGAGARVACAELR